MVYSKLIYCLILHNWKEMKAYYPQIIPEENGQKVRLSQNYLLYTVLFSCFSLFSAIWCFARNTDIFAWNFIFASKVHIYYENTYLYKLFNQYLELHNVRKSCILQPAATGFHFRLANNNYRGEKNMVLEYIPSIWSTMQIWNGQRPLWSVLPNPHTVPEYISSQLIQTIHSANLFESKGSFYFGLSIGIGL